MTSKHKCVKHQVFHHVEVPEEAKDRYWRWTEGKIFIQDVPLSVDQREILLTGTCQETWDEMFVTEDCSDDCDGSWHLGKMCR